MLRLFPFAILFTATNSIPTAHRQLCRSVTLLESIQPVPEIGPGDSTIHCSGQMIEAALIHFDRPTLLCRAHCATCRNAGYSRSTWQNFPGSVPTAQIFPVVTTIGNHCRFTE